MTRKQIIESAWVNFRPMIARYIDVDLHLVAGESTWEELGLDSLDFVEMIMMVEEEFNVELSEREVDDAKTLGDLHILLMRTIQGDREVAITIRNTINTRCSLCGRS